MNLSQREFQALISILQRAPMTPAEAIWLETFIQRMRTDDMQAAFEQKRQAEDKSTAEDLKRHHV